MLEKSKRVSFVFDYMRRGCIGGGSGLEIGKGTMEPTIDQVKALNGRIFAMLSEDELEVYKFFRDRGRKFGVAVLLIPDEPYSDEVAEDLARAATIQHTEEILRRRNTRVCVTVQG